MERQSELSDWLDKLQTCDRYYSEQVRRLEAGKEKLRDILEPNSYQKISENRLEAWKEAILKQMGGIKDFGKDFFPRIKDEVLWLRTSSEILQDWDRINYFWRYPKELER